MHDFAGLSVQCSERFVHEQDSRSGHQCTGNRYTLLHPPRQLRQDKRIPRTNRPIRATAASGSPRGARPSKLVLSGLETLTRVRSRRLGCRARSRTGRLMRAMVSFQSYSLVPLRAALGPGQASISLGRDSRVRMSSAPRGSRCTVARDGSVVRGIRLSCQLSGGCSTRVCDCPCTDDPTANPAHDEPFGALDAQTREVMHDLICMSAARSCSVVFVTHDVEERSILGRRVVLMAPRPGRIQSITKCRPPRARAEMKHAPEFLKLKF